MHSKNAGTGAVQYTIIKNKGGKTMENTTENTICEHLFVTVIRAKGLSKDDKEYTEQCLRCSQNNGWTALLPQNIGIIEDKKEENPKSQ